MKENWHGRAGLFGAMAGCGDCHSPKKMSNMGQVEDSAKFLSGHPADSKLPPIDQGALKPGSWSLMGPGATSFVGPWGISFSAILHLILQLELVPGVKKCSLKHCKPVSIWANQVVVIFCRQCPGPIWFK